MNGVWLGVLLLWALGAFLAGAALGMTEQESLARAAWISAFGALVLFAVSLIIYGMAEL